MALVPVISGFVQVPGQGPNDVALSCSDLTTALTVSSSVAYWDYTFATRLSGVEATLIEAPTGSTFIVNIKNNGVSILSTLLSIDVGELTSRTAASPAVISGPNIAVGDRITVDITQIGAVNAGKGLIVTLISH